MRRSACGLVSFVFLVPVIFVRVFSMLRVVSILIIITLVGMLNIKPEILIAITTRGTITYREQSDYNYDHQDDDDY